MSMSVAPMKEKEAMDMKEQAEKFRKVVLERGGVGPRARYTTEQRQEAVEYVRARQQQGGERGGSGEGVGHEQLDAQPVGQRGAASRPAAAREDGAGTRGGEGRACPSARRGLVVHGPGGVRVEGLSLEEAVRLLRGLL
ncbi:hypothetical protein ACN28S_29895 [Cystobacter fuscus]